MCVGVEKSDQFLYQLRDFSIWGRGMDDFIIREIYHMYLIVLTKSALFCGGVKGFLGNKLVDI